MSRKDTVNALFKGALLGAPNKPGNPGVGSSQQPRAEDPKTGGPSLTTERGDRVRTGAISAMGTSLAQLAESAKTAARLQEQIAAGDIVIDLDPNDVDGSLISDRLVIEVDPSFDALVASIADSGQQVPILVRPHASQKGRYQVAYGHRRLRATARLGIKVKAVVRSLSDADLVIAQGKENLERRDLSYLERALFARRLEESGFDRSIVISALSCDKSDVSRYVAIARAIPEEIALAIGPAPKAGRARWADLSERLRDAGARESVDALIRQADFLALPTDQRFSKVLEVLRSPGETANAPERWAAKDGRQIVQVRRGSERLVLSFDQKIAPDFGDFILGELDSLLAAYERARRHS